ncbi:MAG TPA: hypothetical protein VMV53_11450 [Acidimicrobiales bacterium]|nr:hypothetical protein [Acidimicrobiales bacterium]
MPQRDSRSAAAIIETYNPAIGRHHLVSPAEWRAVANVVREAVAPFGHLRGEQIRDYLRSMTKLAAFVGRLEGEMSVAAVLAPTSIRGFLRNQPAGVRDEEPYLWRLARAHGTVPVEAPVRHQVGRHDLKAPYATKEIEALLLAAHSQPTELRQLNVPAIVVLGAGAGLVRESSRDVCASDVHRHEDGVFVRARGRCAKVLPAFEAELEELVRRRPKGRLLGTAQSRFITAQAHQWLDDRRGVPRLSVDRLRASYLIDLMRRGHTLVEVMAWSGLKTTDTLWRLASHLPVPSTCPRGDA